MNIKSEIWKANKTRLEAGNKEAAKTFQQFTDLIQKDRETIEGNEYFINQHKREIETLILEKARLENNISSIPLNDETYIRVMEMVRQVIESLISNPKKLLAIGLATLFESSRKHPGKFQALYYNMPSHLSVEQILSESSINQNASPYRYCMNEDEKILLDEAEQSYNRIVNAITNTCINKMPNNTESSSQILQVPDVNDDRLSSVEDTYKILDTRDLSQINLTYNNITYRVYPDSGFTNEQRSETQTRPSKNELDRYNFSQE